MDCFEYVKSAKSGDREAFLFLYNLYRDKLYRYAFYRLGNAEDSMDAVSDTVLSAYENISKLKKEEAFASWLFSIHRASCNRYIKSAVKRRNEDNIDNVDIISHSNGLDVSVELREALSKLNEQEREIVLLSVVAGFTSDEIGKVVGLRSGSVRSKQSRALAKMRTFME